MKYSLKQERYKFNHSHMSIYGAISLIILMLYTAFSSKVTSNTIIQNFGAGQWLTIIIITISSTFLSMEYSYNTMLTLRYKRKTNAVIYFSKMLVLIIYTAILLILSLFVTFVLKEITVGGQYNWEDLIANLSLNIVGSLIYEVFIITLALFLISIFKNNSAVIVLGLFNSFLGSSMSSAIMDDFNGVNSILKWNPFNMIYIMNQLSSTKNFFALSHLTNIQIIMGNLLYIIIFIIFGYLAFKKRQV